jgi:hypothetical protein
MFKRLDVMIHNFLFVARYNWFPRKEAIRDYKLMKDNQFFDFLNEIPDKYKSPALSMKVLHSVMQLREFGIRSKPLAKWASTIMDIYNHELMETVEQKQKLESLLPKE